MSKTIERKRQEVEKIKKRLEESSGFLVFGFNRVPVNRLNSFRARLREKSEEMQVVKRRLFSLCLKGKEIDFQPEPFLGQTAIIAFRDDIFDVASLVCDFVKEDEVDGKILGGYDIKNKKAYDAEYLEKVGQLPSRDILLSQVISGLSGPIRAFVYTLKAIADKG